MSILRKPISAIDQQDLAELVSAQARETSELEFKGALPFRQEKGQPQTVDRWVEQGDRVGNFARDQLLEELVAFANAEGGTLVLGVHETKDEPRRAERLEPLPRCEELARRLTDAAEDLIEPRIPIIEGRGIPADKDGSGFVVLRVGKSAAAPHRLNSTGGFYIRRGERSYSMTVREIRDLTLELARSGDRIEKAFQDRWQAAFVESHRLINIEAANSPLFIRATALPLTSLSIANLTSRKEEFWWRGGSFNLKVGEADYFCDYPSREYRLNPEIRLRALESRRRPDETGTSRLIGADGLVEFTLADIEAGASSTEMDTARMYISWLLGPVIGALCQVAFLRRRLGIDGLEYGLQVDIICSQKVRLRWQQRQAASGALLPAPVNGSDLPRLSVGAVSEFDTLLSTLLVDLFNAAGSEFKMQCQVPWEDLIGL